MEQKIKHWLDISMAIAKNASGSAAHHYAVEIEKRQNILRKYHLQKQDMSLSSIKFLTKEKLCGKFSVIGQNPDDKKSCYHGTLEISYQNEGWQAEWEIGGYYHQAFGMLVAPNVLVFNFTYEEENMPKSGLVAYSFLTPDIVTGYWIEEGYPEKGTEHLRRLQPDEDMHQNISTANLGFSLN